MRQGPNGRRPRGRPNRKQHGGPSRPNSYDSGGPEGRIRGNANQVYEKYIGLARDAVSAGDRVVAEAYYQHAEHYFRIVNASTDPATAKPPPRSEGNGSDGNARETSGADARDHRPSGRESGAGRQGPAPRGQDVRRNETARNADERQPSRDAPSNNTQSASAAPARTVEDREGLDRVLGKEEAESPQAESHDPPDREAGQTSKRRRSGQRPARRQETEAAGDGAERQERAADRTDNGVASDDSPAQDSTADEAVSGQQEATETAAPREKDRGSEPADA